MSRRALIASAMVQKKALLAKDYKVRGAKHRSLSFNTERAGHLYRYLHRPGTHVSCIVVRFETAEHTANGISASARPCPSFPAPFVTGQNQLPDQRLQYPVRSDHPKIIH